MKFSTLKINCASLGALMSTPKDNRPPTEREFKELYLYLSREYQQITDRQKSVAHEIMTKSIAYDKDRFTLTVKNEICKIYSYEMYGKSALNAGGTKPYTLDKGNLAEPQSIKMLSEIDGIEYIKNERLISNKYFKGIPDIIIGKYKKFVTGVKEIKTSYDLPAFLHLFNEPPDKDNVWQMMGYLDILGLESGEICHCLVNMPEEMIKAEQDRVMERCQKLGIEEADIEKRLFALKASMIYDEIPKEMRIIRYTIEKDGRKLRSAHSRTTLARKWLKELHESFNKPLK